MNVPPSRSSWLELALARRARRPPRALRRSRRSTCARRSRITGTTRPCARRTAMPDVRARVDLDRVVRVVRVDRAVAHAARRRRASSGRRSPSARSSACAREPLAQLLRARHVGGHRDLEGGRLPRLGEPARDRLAERRELSRPPTSRGAEPDGGVRGRRSPRARRPRRRSGPPGRCRASAPRSMPRSRAIRRASGDALMRAPRSRLPAPWQPRRRRLRGHARAPPRAQGRGEPSSCSVAFGDLRRLLASTRPPRPARRSRRSSCRPRPRPRRRRSSAGRREASASTSCVTLSVSSS